MYGKNVIPSANLLKTFGSNLIVPWLLLIYGLVVIITRAPEIVFEPRYWAEEATLYFKYASQENWWRSLLFVPMGQGGYLSLSANLPALLATRFVSMEAAPVVSTLIAGIVLWLPVFLISFGSSYLWRTPLQKFVAVTLYLFAPIHPEESWLNSINSMSYLGVVSLVILCEETNHLSKKFFWFEAILLVYNSLSAVYTVFLAPAFFFKAYFHRGTRNLAHLLAVVVPSSIQVIIFTALAFTGGVPTKKFNESMSLARGSIAALHFHVFEPLLGVKSAEQFTRFLGLRNFIFSSEAMANFTTYNALEITLAFSVVLIFFMTICRQKFKWIIFVAFITESFFASVGAMHGVAGGRYAIVPQFALLLLVLLVFFQRPFSINFKVLAGQGVVLLVLVNSLVSGFKLHSDRNYYSYSNNKPHWRREVRKWRKNPAYKLKVWPAGWEFALPSRTSMDALRSFAERIQQVPSQSQLGSLLDKNNELVLTSSISEVPVEGRIILKIDKKLCNNVNKATLSFRAQTQTLKFGSQRVNCSEFIFIIKGPLQSKLPIEGYLKITPKIGRSLSGNELEFIEAKPVKAALI